MAASKVQQKEYQTPEQQEVARATDSSNTGTSAGDYSPTTYYTDEDGKVTTTAPERGSVLLAEGDVVTEDVAARIKGVK